MINNRENLNTTKVSDAIKEFVINYDKYDLGKKEF